MVSTFVRFAGSAVVAFALALGAVPAIAESRELATAQGSIVILEARPGLRAPSCSELIVEARDALDNHLIAETKPARDEAGTCRYALSIPAQTAVWLRLQPVLVSGAHVINGAIANAVLPERARYSSGSVGLRFTIITAATYFFAPNEQKTIPLNY